MTIKTQKKTFIQNISDSLESLLQHDVITQTFQMNTTSEDKIIGWETNDYIYGEITLNESKDMEDSASAAYKFIIQLLTERGKLNLWRCWNFIPKINEASAGRNRYHQFCSGRYKALIKSGFISESSLCAASAVGTNSDLLSICFIASRHQGKSIDNPNQIKAYKYPKIYGNHSPSFARAYLANNILFISGTASIIGHESQHYGDLSKQLHETKNRLDELLRERHPILIIAYVRNQSDISIVTNYISIQYNKTKQIQIIKADICRKELLVEIEMIAR